MSKEDAIKEEDVISVLEALCLQVRQMCEDFQNLKDRFEALENDYDKIQW